jgi:pilus assembly protein CpaF
MLDFLSEALNAGISICSCGATSSGKTTLMSYLLSNVPDEKRIVTIENEVREFNLVRADISGGVKNNVIHLVSKESKENIRQEKLLEYALTANPDIICVAEAKSGEAFQAQEAARTGHAVITTVHANSCEEAYYRLFTLCKQKSDIGDDLLYRLISDAFPIMF